jgi:hypothetical protein
MGMHFLKLGTEGLTDVLTLCAKMLPIVIALGLQFSTSAIGGDSAATTRYPDLAPLVGKIGSFEGRVSMSKSGWHILTAKGPIFVFATLGENEKLNALCESLNGKNAAVNGKLNWRAFVPSSKGVAPAETYWINFREARITAVEGGR